MMLITQRVTYVGYALHDGKLSEQKYNVNKYRLF